MVGSFIARFPSQEVHQARIGPDAALPNHWVRMVASYLRTLCGSARADHPYFRKGPTRNETTFGFPELEPVIARPAHPVQARQEFSSWPSNRGIPFHRAARPRREWPPIDEAKPTQVCEAASGGGKSSGQVSTCRTFLIQRKWDAPRQDDDIECRSGATRQTLSVAARRPSMLPVRREFRRLRLSRHFQNSP